MIIGRIRSWLFGLGAITIGALAMLLRIQTLKSQRDRLKRQRDHAEYTVQQHKQHQAQQKINEMRKKVVMKQLEDVRNGRAPRNYFE